MPKYELYNIKYEFYSNKTVHLELGIYRKENNDLFPDLEMILMDFFETYPASHKFGWDLIKDDKELIFKRRLRLDKKSFSLLGKELSRFKTYPPYLEFIRDKNTCLLNVFVDDDEAINILNLIKDSENIEMSKNERSKLVEIIRELNAEWNK